MKKLLFYIILLLGTAVTLATLGSVVGPEQYWWIKVLDFPRIQLLISAVVLLSALMWAKNEWSFGSGILLVALLSVIIIQLYYIYPYSGLVKTTVDTVLPNERSKDSTLRLLVANIDIKNRQPQEFLKLVEETNPDIILAIETDEWWQKALRPLDDRFPYSMKQPQANGYGMILYSRFALSEKEVKYLNYQEVPSLHTTVELPAGAVIRFHGLHPVPPYPRAIGKAGGKEMALKKVGSLVDKDSLPAVVAGDLNDVAWSQRERLFEQDGLLNDVRVGRGIYNTYNAQSSILRWPLDYVYVTTDFGVSNLRRLRHVGSDHFPLYIKLSLLQKGN